MASSTSSDEIIILVAAALVMKQQARRKKRLQRSVRTENWLKRRNSHLLHQELRLEDQEAYRNYMRMDKDCFEVLLNKIKHKITYKDTNYRESISARLRLTITLRFLATGETFQSLSYQFRVGRSTICGIIPQVVNAICDHFVEENIRVPMLPHEWETVEKVFRENWNFPNCCGAIDARLINFSPPRSEGRDGLVLMAIVDTNYRFLCVEVGADGRHVSEGGLFKNSQLSEYINSNTFQMPENIQLLGSDKSTPFVFVGSDAFPLSNRIMKPFRYHGLNKNQKVYNLRLSRVRSVADNAFGILANRFRVLLNTIHLSAFKVEKITTACCILHNFLISKIGQNYTGDADEINAHTQTLHALDKLMYAGNRSTNEAVGVRNVFMDYFNNEGQVLWQGD